MKESNFSDKPMLARGCLGEPMGGLGGPREPRDSGYTYFMDSKSCDN